jgi:hypothetical protein
MVKSATRMTGASEVMDDTAFGFASSHFLSAGTKSPIVVRDVKVQKKETGKICQSASASLRPTKDVPRLE